MRLREYREDDFDDEAERHHFRDFFPGWLGQGRPDYQRGAFRENKPWRIQLLEQRLKQAPRREAVGEVAFLRAPAEAPVHQDVEVMREDLEITRHPVNRPATGEERTTVEGDVIRIPIIEEEIVVQKRLVLKEIVEIRKRQTRERKRIDDTLRAEQISFTGSMPEEEPRPGREGPPRR
jgi:uncharacterized protein (TIGR02271 family)